LSRLAGSWFHYGYFVMIIYIHGFASSGFGNKARYFRSACQDSGEPFMAPSLPYNPELAITNLCDIIEYAQPHEPIHLIGSSLGGYYGLYLAHRYGLKVALINPSVKPVDTLGQLTGWTQHYHDGSQFEWTDVHTQALQTLAVPATEALQQRTLLLVQTGDETLDYREAVAHLPTAQQVIEPGGDHGFQGIERHTERLLSFFAAP